MEEGANLTLDEGRNDGHQQPSTDSSILFCLYDIFEEAMFIQVAYVMSL